MGGWLFGSLAWQSVVHAKKESVSDTLSRDYGTVRYGTGLYRTVVSAFTIGYGSESFPRGHDPTTYLYGYGSYMYLQYRTAAVTFCLTCRDDPDPVTSLAPRPSLLAYGSTSATEYCNIQ